MFLGLGLVIASGLAALLLVPSAKPGPIHEGGSAPSFALTQLGGTATVGVPTDGGGSGRAAILLFFASWCPPCNAELPALAHAYAEESKDLRQRVSLIGVDVSDPTGPALRFIHRSDVTFPVGADHTFSVAEGLYDLSFYPGAIAVSRTGVIDHIKNGPLTVAELRTWEHQLAS